jgi:hypothetical protein
MLALCRFAQSPHSAAVLHSDNDSKYYVLQSCTDDDDSKNYTLQCGSGCVSRPLCKYCPAQPGYQLNVPHGGVLV